MQDDHSDHHEEGALHLILLAAKGSVHSAVKFRRASKMNVLRRGQTRLSRSAVARWQDGRLESCRRPRRLLHSSVDVCAQGDRPRNIFEEADEEDGENDAGQTANGLLKRQRDSMAREPVWEGDERVQDTVLRMLMDKHQPLRIKAQAGQHPADVKMASVQKPNMIASPSFGQSSDVAPITDVERLTKDLPTPDDEGRRLAKTPDNKPWRAVYVNPMVSGENGQPAEPSIYFAKHLVAGRVMPRTASGKERLRLAGVKTDSLPFDDRTKMRAIREGVRRWDRAGRMRGVKEEAMQYRREREEERERRENDAEPMPMSDDELDALLNAEGVLKEGEEIRLSSASDSKPGEAQIAMMGGRGFASIANERIEAAMKTSYFQQNSLRGKPMQKDVYASNPYLSGEERIMNRIVQRQGAAPPWVELNVQVESEQSDFRSRLAESWLRRATRIILATAHLRDGLEPVDVTSGERWQDVEQRGPALTDGQRKTLHMAKVYVDPEWEQREQAYHEASLRDVNSLIRRYNVVAPVSARRGLLVREWELKRVREECRALLVQRLSHDLQSRGSSSTTTTTIGGAARSSLPTSSATSSSLFGGKGSAQRDSMLGRESNPSVGAGRGRLAIGGDGESVDAGFTDSEGNHHRSRRPRETSAYASQLASLVRRTAIRARQLVNW